MKPTPEQFEELLRIVAATRDREIDCEEFLTRVGAYLERAQEAGGSDPIGPELEIVSQHLDVCPSCREEYDALLDAYRRDQ